MFETVYRDVGNPVQLVQDIISGKFYCNLDLKTVVNSSLAPTSPVNLVKFPLSGLYDIVLVNFITQRWMDKEKDQKQCLWWLTLCPQQSQVLKSSAHFGVFGKPLKHYQISWNFVWCNNFPRKKFLLHESWTFKKLNFYETPYSGWSLAEAKKIHHTSTYNHSTICSALISRQTRTLPFQHMPTTYSNTNLVNFPLIMWEMADTIVHHGIIRTVIC